jgi:hypothetical protein
VAYLLVALIGLFSSSVVFSGQVQTPSDQVKKWSAIVEEFRGRLGISDPISLSMVQDNKHLISVRRSPSQAGSFLIELDEKFLETLSEEEQRAALAHELGHVWIFTHHPYLQTEALANEKALQLVQREVLEKVYEKVWRQEGQNGTLAQFLSKVE